jgi:hypothetical protein
LLLSQIQAGRCLGEKDYRTAEYDFQAPRQKNFKETWPSVATLAAHRPGARQAAGTSSRSTPPR